MIGYWKKIENFISELQRSDDVRKKRWLYGSATLAIFLIVGLWLVYLNFTIFSSGGFKVEGESEKKDSVFKTFARGLGVIKAEVGERGGSLAGDLSKSIGAVKEQAEKQNGFIIESEGPELFFKNPEPIPPGEFPLAR